MDLEHHLYYFFKKIQRADPSHTLTLRNFFAKDMRGRFKDLDRVIRESIVKNDCFGLRGPKYNLFARNNYINRLFRRNNNNNGVNPIPPNELAGEDVGAQIDMFEEWVSQVEDHLFFTSDVEEEIGESSTFWKDYITQAYRSGIKFAKKMIKRDKALMKKLGLSPYELDITVGAITRDLRNKINDDAMNLLYDRVYTDLKGITSTIESQLRRILSDGLTIGESPLKIAKDISEKISTIGINRGELIARTEVIRAHHIASINQYKKYGVEKVGVEVEWVTAVDPCPICEELRGKTFTLDEIYPMLPRHPRCRCVAVPVVE